MQLIFAAALCSVLVSILLKLCKRQGFDVLQMIACNYAVASMLCWLWFKPDLIHISIVDTPWWLIVVLGIILPSLFLGLAKSLQISGILKTEIAQRLSVVLSLLAAYFLFGEQFNQLKIIGVILGIAAVLCILFSRVDISTTQRSKQGMLYLLCVWVGYALVDILLKYTTSLGLQFAVTLNLMLICAFVLSVLYLTLIKTSWQLKNMGAGFALGALNFANIALYVKAHMLLKDSPAVVFAGMNILVVMFGVIAGLLIFKEQLKIATVLSLILGLAGVVCLALA